MPTVTVVGSGASGVHFAQTALEMGYDVTMVDVGFAGERPVLPEASFDGLKDRLDDPAGYFLGPRFEGVVLPTDDAEYYGFPPGKAFVFRAPEGFRSTADGFAPLFSFARGGLAEAWTGGAYPLHDDDLRAFPWGHAELAPWYGEVARRIGVSGAADDLARFLPVHEHLEEPPRLDRHSALLLERYARHREALNAAGVFMGRTRVATLTRAREDRGACTYLGRCLFGCPVDALYTPALTLRRLLADPRFSYVGGTMAESFRTGPGRRITALVVRPAGGGERRELPVDHLVLAAGTLASATILLRAVYEETGRIERLAGLMDNRQVLMPFGNLRLVGRSWEPESYQYHEVGLGLTGDDPADYVHGQVTTLKTALMHPIIHRLPFDLRVSARLARMTHAALGVVNANFSDTRREDNFVTLAGEGDAMRLAMRYAPPAGEAQRVGRALARIRRLLWTLGCVVPPGMTHVRPMGASVHYAGTLPMSRERRPWSTTPDAQSQDFENLWLADGSSFPFLPAKNLTFTLMANAVRVARKAL
jgi:choline dehydrogenase-like flavoprotein